MTTQALIRGFVLVALGIGIGYTAAYLRLQPATENAPAAPRASGARPAPAADRPDLADVLVSVRGGGRSFSAALLGSPPALVVPAAFAAGAERIEVRSAAGATGRATEVVAASVESDLAALSVDLGLASGLPVRREQGTLYIGRTFVSPGDSGVNAGWIDAPARQTRLGGYVYDAMMGGAASASVLLDPATAAVVGVSTGPVDPDGRFVAVDAAAIADLLDGRRSWPATDLDGFRTWYYRESPAGRVAELTGLADSERWDEIVTSARMRLGLADGYGDDIAPLIDLGYTRAATELESAGMPGQALDLLDEARQLLGASATRELMSARLHEATGDPVAALDAYLSAAVDAADTRDARHRARTLIAGTAAAGTVSDTALLAMIDRAAAADARHAPYPLLAGEILLRQGRTSAAAVQLRRALAMQPDLAPRIDPLLETAQGRLTNPSQIRVPVVTRGDVMIVQVRINDSPRPYRFVLDTGASYTAVSLQAALELGINAMFTGTPTVELETANGRVFADVVNLASVTLGEARAGNVDAVILETMRGVDGLLGQSFLGRFDVRIRPGADEVLLSPR